MYDRLPTYPGRVTLTPVPGQEHTYDMVMADDPTQVGTPPTKANLLSDETAAKIWKNPNGAETVSEALARIPTLIREAKPSSFQKYMTGRWG